VERTPAELLALAQAELPRVAELSEGERARVRRFLERAWGARAGYDALHKLRPLTVGAHALFSAQTASGDAMLGATKSPLTPTHLFVGLVERATFAPDRRAFVLGMSDASARKNVYYAHPDAPGVPLDAAGEVTFSADGRLVATKTASGVAVFDLTTQRPFAEFACKVDPAPRFTAWGDLVLVDPGRPHRGPDQGLGLFDLDKKEVVVCEKAPSASLSPDERFIASVVPGPKGGAVFEYALTVYDRKTGIVQTVRVPGAEDERPDVFFQADGTLILSSKKPNIMAQQFEPTVRGRWSPRKGTAGGLEKSSSNAPVPFDDTNVWTSLTAPYRTLVNPPMELIPSGFSLYSGSLSYARSADGATLALLAGERPFMVPPLELLLVDLRTQKLLHRVQLERLDGLQTALAFGPRDHVIATTWKGDVAFSVSRIDGSLVALPAFDAGSLAFDGDGSWVTDRQGSPWIDLATGKAVTLPTIEASRFEAYLAAGRPAVPPPGVLCRIGRSVVPVALCGPRYPDRATDTDPAATRVLR
jgi:hypothetical protein